GRWRNGPAKLERPQEITALRHIQGVASRQDRHILLAVNGIRRSGSVGAGARLELPQLFARLDVVRDEVSVRLAMEEKPTGRAQQPAAAAHRIFRFLLPHDFIRRRIYRRERSRALHTGWPVEPL